MRAADELTAQYVAAARVPVDVERLALWDVYVSAAALATMAQWGLPPDVEARRRERTTAFFQKSAETATSASLR